MSNDVSRFKDPRGRWYTNGVFLETAADKSTAVYTLRDYDYERDGVKYPSLKLLYMEMADVTEYEFAMAYLGSWSQWKRVANLATKMNKRPVRKHIEEWREELEIKLRAAALRNIAAISMGDKGYQAAKYMADAGWKDKGAKKNPKVKDAIADDVAEDFERLGLHRVK